MELRNYQIEIINKTKQAIINGKKRICIVLPCGGGKSIILGNLIKSANIKGNQVLVLIHRVELKKQLIDTFSKYGCDMNLTQVEMVQTASRHIEKIKQPKIIITDEGHLSLANSYLKIFNYFADSFLIACTATPIRLNSDGLGVVYEELIEGVTTKWLIENKYLAPFEYYSYVLADTSKLKITNGEYDEKQATKLFDKPIIYGDVFKHWQRLANNKKTIVFASSILHSKKIVEMFLNNGISAAHIDGTTDHAERADIIQKFRTGEITVLSNFLIVSEGLDVPDCQATILLKPTKSTARFLQSAMRSMRYMPNKVAIIIDHCGNVFEHGALDDDRKWTLNGKNKRIKTNSEPDILCRQCANCFRVYGGLNPICPYCNYDNKKTQRQIKQDEQAELERIEAAQIKQKKTEERQATTLEQLIALGRARGYKSPEFWAHKKFYNSWRNK